MLTARQEIASDAGNRCVPVNSSDANDSSGSCSCDSSHVVGGLLCHTASAACIDCPNSKSQAKQTGAKPAATVHLLRQLVMSKIEQSAHTADTVLDSPLGAAPLAGKQDKPKCQAATTQHILRYAVDTCLPKIRE
jgi:hypothetical protein